MPKGIFYFALLCLINNPSKWNQFEFLKKSVVLLSCSKCGLGHRYQSICPGPVRLTNSFISFFSLFFLLVVEGDEKNPGFMATPDYLSIYN